MAQYSLDSSVVISYRCNLLGEIVSVNQTLEIVSGYSREELIGQSESFLMCSDMPDKIFQDMWSIIALGKAWRGKLKYRRKDGDYYWVVANIAPWLRNKETVGYLVLCYPDSNRSELICDDSDVVFLNAMSAHLRNLEMDRMNMSLYYEDSEARHGQLIQQSRYAVMGEMLAVISHQWRQPLSVGLLNVEILNAKLNLMPLEIKDKELLLSRLSIIRDMLIEKSQLLDEFSDFFKPNRSSKLFSIFFAVKSVLSMFEDSFFSGGIKITKSIDPEANLLGCEREFKLVLVNIVKNSVEQFVNHHVPSPSLQIELIVQNDHYCLEVRDNAGGIPTNILPNIFDAYVSTKSLNGTGLGLYMANTIITEQFSGQMTAYNKNEGAVVQIVIPISNE